MAILIHIFQARAVTHVLARVITHVLARVVTHVLVLPYGASHFDPHFASTCSNTRASMCSNTHASTCHYACARLLFKNMRSGCVPQLAPEATHLTSAKSGTSARCPCHVSAQILSRKKCQQFFLSCNLAIDKSEPQKIREVDILTKLCGTCARCIFKIYVFYATDNVHKL